MRATIFVGLTLACGCAPTDPPHEERAETVETAGSEQPIAQPEVRSLADAPHLEAPPGTARIAILARGANAFVGRLEIDPGTRVPEHRDADEEYIVVLQGRGTVHIDGVARPIGPGDTIFMPSNALVSFENGDERMVAIQVFAGPSSASKYERWTSIGAAHESVSEESAGAAEQVMTQD